MAFSHSSLGAAVVIGSVMSVACVDATARESMPTLSVGQLARQIESFKGRHVRACGGRLDLSEVYKRWAIQSIGDPNPHGAIVNVVPCPGVTPRLDGRGCIAGRIAYRDGTLDETRQTGPITMSSAITSYVWYLHAQCPVRL